MAKKEKQTTEINSNNTASNETITTNVTYNDQFNIIDILNNDDILIPKCEIVDNLTFLTTINDDNNLVKNIEFNPL